MLHHPQNWINWSKLKTEDQHSTNLPPPQNSSDIIDEKEDSNNNSETAAMDEKEDLKEYFGVDL